MRRFVQVSGLAVLTVMIVTSVDASTDSRILNVERFAEMRADVVDQPQLLRQRLVKFPREHTKTEISSVSYYVDWSPSEGGLPPGTTLHFDYRQEHVNRIQSLHIRYPFEVIDERRATFEIGDKAFRRGGDIVAWRVRLEHSGKTLAEYASDSWR